VVLGLLPQQAEAEPVDQPAKAPAAAPAPVDKSKLSAAQATEVLGAGWQKSTDRAWTLVPAKDGLNVLVAKESEAYAWKPIASLSEPGFDTDQWIGNACITDSGNRLVVVYAPRGFTNDEVARDRAAFTAVVDLNSGAVRKLAVTSTLAYFNPGCGSGEAAVLSQYDHSSSPRTRLIKVDAATGKTTRPMVSSGEVTSAVPIGNKIVAALGRRLVEVGPQGQLTPRSTFAGAVSRLRVADGRLVLSDTAGERTTVRRLSSSLSTPEVIGSGDRTTLTTFQAPGGKVFLAGARQQSKVAPGIGFAPAGKQQISANGGLIVKDVALGKDGQAVISAVTRAGTPADFEVPLPAGSSGSTSPALTLGQATATAGEADTPIDAGATCAVPRNDIQTQVYQPNPRQIEWAVDQAVNNNLKTARPADWKRSGLPSYAPQLLTQFQLPALHGGGTIPAQVLLGILAQESNLWQASGHAIETWTGNPLIGNFYGRVGNGWSIDFSKADCGYGVGQITDGMRKGDTVWGGLNEQRAIALDYTVNIAAAAKILAGKWNELYDAGLLIDGAKASRIESWFGAVWAYNSGFHPKPATAGEPWGLGWTNNPLSGLWDPARTPFRQKASDAAHPQDWPYPEKIMGWAAFPIDNPRLGAGYRAAWWSDSGGVSGVTKRLQVKPPLATFCSLSVNACDPAAAAGEHCTRADDKCWWYPAVSWKDCNNATADPCGHGLTRFDTTYPEPQPDQANTPPDPEQNPPVCDASGLPANAQVVDDVPAGTWSRRPQCGSPSNSAGTFALKFGAVVVNGEPVQYTSKIDFHQIGLGYQGHAWFTHTTWNQEADQSHTVTGTWTLGSAMPGWARVLVHLPGVASNTRQAEYVIDRGDGRPPVARYVNTSVGANKWVSLGVVQLGAGRPSVTLSNRTYDAKYFDSTINPWALDRQENIAWDAVAFQPLPAKPLMVAAVGDSYGSGEGAGDYFRETNHDGGNKLARSACHRSQNAWARRVHPPVLGGASLGEAADAFSTKAELNFVSCSGAVAANVSGSVHVPTQPSYLGGGQYDEIAQLEAGYVDENTDIVFVSIGGNDADFGNVLMFCGGVSAAHCYDDIRPGHQQTLDVEERELIANEVQTEIGRAIERISLRAPNAQIVYTGYPRIFDGTPIACPDGFGVEEMSWMNDMSNLLAEKTIATLDLERQSGRNVSYVDTRPAFTDGGVCKGTGLNQIMPIKTDGDDPADTVSAESFHPNAIGNGMYADAVEEKMGW
jgi:hypothetical protein